MSRPRASPPSRVGLLNGRKLRHQYLLCEQRGSAGVNRPGASAAPRHAKSGRHSAQTASSATMACFPSPPSPAPPPFFFLPPPSAITTQSDRLGPQTVVFDLIASSARELLPSTPPARAPPGRCRPDTVRTFKWHSCYDIRSAAAPPKYQHPVDKVVALQSDPTDCWCLSVPVFTEMGSAALLLAVLAGALLSISAIHAGESLR